VGWLLAVSTVFVVIGIWMILDPEGSSRRSAEWQIFGGWFSVVFFGSGTLIGLYTLVKPIEILLTAEGFQIRGPRRGRLVPWNGVESFYVTKVHGAKFVFYKKTEGAPSLLGAMGDVSLPPQLDRSPEALRDLMEQWRTRYASSH
jgi:hypothetical protein